MVEKKTFFLPCKKRNPNFNTKIELYSFQDYSVLTTHPQQQPAQKQQQPNNYEPTP